MKRMLLDSSCAIWLGLLSVCTVACRETQPAPASSSSPPRSPHGTATPPAPTTAASPVRSGAPTGSARPTFAFDADPPGAPPKGFSFGRTGEGPEGKWVVRPEPDAPSGPHVVAQVDADSTSFRFPLAVADEPVLRDVRVSVRCKMLSGTVDQACGLVLRYRDVQNYYVTRANVLENNLRFYWVKDGKRQQLASANVPVEAGRWHSYRIEASGDRFQVFWNDQQVLEHRDATFAEPGRVGVWTKADSVTLFDDLQAEAL